MNRIDDKNPLAELGLARRAGQDDPSRLGQEDFLQLMITQLNNQDPFKPMASGEFLTQIAQFSQASGIQELQNSFAELSGALTSSQALQASALVGRTVLVQSDEAALAPGGTVSGRVELPQPVQSLQVEVLGPAGEVVRRLDLGPQAAGQAAFTWDGRDDAGNLLPPGAYTLRAVAGAGGESAAATVLLAARVDSVTLGGGAGGITLNLAGLGQRSLGDVREIM